MIEVICIGCCMGRRRGERERGCGGLEGRGSGESYGREGRSAGRQGGGSRRVNGEGGLADA